jgi:Tol biopolymer transport system component
MNFRKIECFGILLSCVAMGLWAGDWPELTGPYAGQSFPNSSPEVFAPGIVSHGFHELGITFSPDGDEIFYIMSDARYQDYALLRTEMKDGRWTEPEVVQFAAHLSVYSASFGPDSNTLYFTGRPPAGAAEPRAEHDIFRVRKTNGRWGTAENIGEPVNTQGSESTVSVAGDGSLYFARDGDDGSSDIWVALPDGDRYRQPVPVGPPLNSSREEGRPCIAPDQSYMLFHSNREGTLGSMDLFVSLRADDGSWTEPVSLGSEVNSAASDFGPSVSPDGRFLFFSSYRGIDPDLLKGKNYRELLELYRVPTNGYATLYWVATAHLDGFPVHPQKYLGQNRPGIVPQVFAEGIVNTEEKNHSSVAVSTKGDELFWSKFSEIDGSRLERIYSTKIENGVWTAPEVVHFSGNFRDGQPSFSPDGTKLFFASQRPIDDMDESGDANIWYVERAKDGWTEPRCLSPTVNSPHQEWFPSVARNGNLYFSYIDAGSPTSWDIYRSRFVDGEYSEPERLSDAVNSPFADMTPYIDPDEEFLIFFSENPHGNFESGKLFYSIKIGENAWTKATPFGPEINTAAARFPGMSLDKEYFFYTNIQSGSEDVYWVDSRIVEQTISGD